MPPKDKGKEKGTAPRDDSILFFYMPNEPNGEFCQWYPSPFSVSKSTIDSLLAYDPQPSTTPSSDEVIHFTCAEQFKMYCKAGRFHDTVTQRKVLATPDPKTQKRLGKAVTGFWDQPWDEVKSDVVIAGNMAKFGQGAKLREKLLATGDKMLAEAARRDRVWGIGFNAEEALGFREEWGENLLGKALMVVRGRLRAE